VTFIASFMWQRF